VIEQSAEACLYWIEKATWHKGGVAAWINLPLQEKGPPYPEVTGYLIPTLMKWGKYDLADQYARWLVKIQQPEGCWLGMDRMPHNFDTAMCMHGLKSIVGNKKVAKSINQAKNYLSGQIKDGSMPMWRGSKYLPFYCVLATAFLGEKDPYWIGECNEKSWPWTVPERIHYILYGLWGLEIMGCDTKKWLDQIRHLPRPLMFWYGPEWNPHWHDPRIDICANNQAAILLKDRSYLAAAEAEQQPDGGILEYPGATRCSSWTAKFYLDALHECMAGRI